MSATSKKVVFTVVAVLIALAVGGYFIFIPQQEKKIEQRIHEFIASLPGEIQADAVKVHFLRNSAEITGLRGTTSYFQQGELKLDISSLSLSGLNFSLGEKPGKGKVADTIHADKSSFIINLPPQGFSQPMKQEVSFSSMDLKGVSGDCSGFPELFGGASLKRQIEVASSFEVKSFALKDYVTSSDVGIGPMIVSIAFYQTEDVTLLSSRNTLVENMSFTALNTEILAINKMTLGLIKMPDFLAPLITALENEDLDAMGDAVLAGINKSPIEMRGWVFEGMRLNVMMPEAVTVDRVEMDLEAGGDRLLLKKSVNGLVLPPFVYSSISLEAAQFASFYDQPLRLDMRMDVELKKAGEGLAELRLKDLFIEDVNLGSARVRADLQGQTDQVYSLMDDKNIALKWGELLLEDKGLVGKVLEAEIAAQGTGGSVAEARNQAAQVILQTAHEGEAGTALATAVAELVKNPGRLLITFAPASPVRLIDSNPQALEALGVSAQFTPASPAQ